MQLAAHNNHGPMIAVPPTTDMGLVFPFDRRSSKFDRSFYSPALTDGRASSEQIETFLKGVEKLIKKKSRGIKLFMGLFIFFVITGFLGLFCVISDIDYLDESTDIDDLFTYFMGYLLAVIFYALLLQLYIRRKQRKAKKSVKSYMKKNGQAFNEQGLRWNAPMFFPQWIELWKDYKGMPGFTQSAPVQNFNTGYMLPQQQPQMVQAQPQQAFQKNVNGNAGLRYQSNNVEDTCVAQPLLSPPSRQIEMGHYYPNNNAF